MEISEVNPDGNVYQLKDSAARAGLAQIAAQNTYSTTEVDTGKKWIDGKTIYRKAGTLANAPASQLNILDVQITSSYVDKIIDAVASGRNEDDNINITGGFMDPGTSRFILEIRPAGLVLMTSIVERTNVAWWIEYTKA